MPPPNNKKERLTWQDKYNALVAHQAEFGTLVPQSAGLKVWVSNQRTAFRKGELKEDHRRQLEALGFDFDRQRNGKDWDRLFQELQVFRAQTGHCRVPYRANKDLRSPLSTWVIGQRHNYQRGTLSDERVQKLEAIGFEWKVNLSYDQMMQHLQKYKREFGHVCVPQHYRTGTLRLGQWVAHTRQKYKRGELDQTFKEKLDGIGFVWTVRDRMEPLVEAEMMGHLQAFQQEAGHLRVHQNYKKEQVNGGKTVHLGRWVKNLRQKWKKKELDENLKAKLDAMGFVWDVSAYIKTKKAASKRQSADAATDAEGGPPRKKKKKSPTKKNQKSPAKRPPPPEVAPTYSKGKPSEGDKDPKEEPPRKENAVPKPKEASAVVAEPKEAPRIINARGANVLEVVDMRNGNDHASKPRMDSAKPDDTNPPARPPNRGPPDTFYV